MSIQVKCATQKIFVESAEHLLSVLEGFAGNHLSVVETLPSGIKKSHFLSIDDNGNAFYTYLDNQRFTPDALHIKG